MSQFSDKSHAGVAAITKRISPNLFQPVQSKLQKSKLEPYNA
jgi:hypothetical protein